MPRPSIRVPIGEIREVSLNQIPYEQGACLYPMSFAYDLDALKASIREVGIINPPILIETEQNNHGIHIITGLRRILAAREVGFEPLMCRVIQAGDISRKDALLLALYDNLTCRQFNIIEKALILTHLSKHFSIPQICDTFMSLLGLAKRPEIYHLYLQIERKLPMAAKEALARGRIHLKAAVSLLAIDNESAVLLVDYGNKLKFTINQFYEFIDIVIDLSHKYNQPVKTILHRQEIGEIINSGTRNLPQKANKLLEVLRSMRSPRVAQTEKRLREKIKTLCLPKGARFILPPFLEDSEYKLEIRFKDGAELSKLLQQMRDTVGSLSLESPLSEALNSGSREENHEV